MLLTLGDRDDRVPLADVQLAVRLLNRHKGADAAGAMAPGNVVRLLSHQQACWASHVQQRARMLWSMVDSRTMVIWRRPI